jgi:hypothetical protein
MSWSAPGTHRAAADLASRGVAVSVTSETPGIAGATCSQ